LDSEHSKQFDGFGPLHFEHVGSHTVLFIYLFIRFNSRKKERKEKKRKRRKSYKDKDCYLYIQNLNIPNLKHKMMNSIKMVKYNSNIDQHLFQHILNIHNYMLLIRFIGAKLLKREYEDGKNK